MRKIDLPRQERSLERLTQDEATKLIRAAGEPFDVSYSLLEPAQRSLALWLHALPHLLAIPSPGDLVRRATQRTLAPELLVPLSNSMFKPASSKKRSFHRMTPWLAACLTGMLLSGDPGISASLGVEPHTRFAEEEPLHTVILQIIGCQPTDPAMSSVEHFSGGESWPSNTRALPPSEVVTRLSAATRFRYGRVQKGGAVAYAQPDARSSVRAVFKEGHELAFCPIQAGMPSGWLKRPDGSYMRTTQISSHAESRLRGESGPAAPLAFLIHTTPLRRDDGSSLAMSRYMRLPVLVNQPAPSGMVRVFGGLLPRSSIRLVLPQPRPQAIPAGARWIYIDRREQVLSAYEGDRMVFATLISTGKTALLAPSGLHRVFYKVVHDTMHGEAGDSYLEEAPFAQYFFRGLSLHGAFWHDDFGNSTSHGCINLSPRDAEWLFGWAPPALSAGSPAALYQSGSQLPLWVLID